jgi:exopolysaccharide production protein ExoZ
MGSGCLLQNIQALRAIAALLVVVIHATEVFSRQGIIRPSAFTFGHAGVDLFFVISGFIMVHVNRGRGTSPLSFAINRIIRIVPLYWILTLVVFAIAFLIPAAVQATKADPIQLLKSLLFIPFVKSNGRVHPVLFVGWTLNYEMFFYALFAIGLLWGERGTLWVVAAMIGFVALDPLTSSPVADFYTDPILLEFAAGMMIGLAFPRLVPWHPRTLIILGFGLILLAPFCWPGVHRALAYGVPGVLIVSGALMLEKAGITIKGLRLLGDASYSIYLTHIFVTGVALRLAPMVPSDAGLALLAISALVAAATFGILVHLSVEKPVTHAFKILSKHRFPRTAPVASKSVRTSVTAANGAKRKS